LSVPHELLLHSHRCSSVVQPRPVGMPERVPSDAELTCGVPPLVVQR
jgi:hypothetical protein